MSTLLLIFVIGLRFTFSTTAFLDNYQKSTSSYIVSKGNFFSRNVELI